MRDEQVSKAPRGVAGSREALLPPRETRVGDRLPLEKTDDSPWSTSPRNAMHQLQVRGDGQRRMSVLRTFHDTAGAGSAHGVRSLRRRDEQRRAAMRLLRCQARHALQVAGAERHADLSARTEAIRLLSWYASLTMEPVFPRRTPGVNIPARANPG